MAAQIRWTGDLSCQRQVEVAEQVAAMTGRDVSAIDSADFELVTQPLSDGTWRLELKTLRRADGTLSSRSLWRSAPSRSRWNRKCPQNWR